MPEFTLHSSNRLEILLEMLSELLEVPLPSPLDAEIILVQSRGMERWVSMELANRHGVCANCRFPFPNSYIRELFGILLPPVEKDSPFAPENLSWKIMGTLPGLLRKPSFAEIRDYLSGGGAAFKLYQLSRKIADLFDQYLLFRPDMIMDWEGGQGPGEWQPELWRELAGERKAPHRAALRNDFLKKAREAVHTRDLSTHGFPARLSVFGISALPPFHLEVLNAAANFTDVHLFVMNPCQEFWDDIEPERVIERKARKSGSKDPEKDLHLTVGNSLLASMGVLGREFLNVLRAFDPQEEGRFVEPGRWTVLSSIQSDILNLLGGPKSAGMEIPPADSSIEIHSCHSPMREVEILQDNLLALFGSRPDIRPRDILVMTPDIEAYAPFIEAVFSLPEDDPRMVPYSIADKGLRVESRTVSAFLALLDLPQGRCGAQEVMDVLESEEIREKFELPGPEVESVRGWVRDACIRWGIDGAHREELGIPGFTENTWRHGLDRMLLGYAMPEKDGPLYGGTMPLEGVEGGDSEVLGRFLAFTERLFAAVTSMKRDRTLAQWSDFLSALIGDFFPERDDISHDLDFLREELGRLPKFGESMPGEVGVDIIRDHLKRKLEMDMFGGGFLAGGITFCAMLPMRSIPFKAICLLGMDDGAYPRDTTAAAFDLMARRPRLGDRSRRNDDRYLFLETILSAREKLYLSFVGQDIRDNSDRPPSVLISELTDYLHSEYGISGMVVKHRLQAFSPDYFRGHGLGSFSRENFEAARSLSSVRQTPEFCTAGLSEPGADFKRISVDDLCRFFMNPAKFFLNKRLGVHLEDRADVLDEREPFTLEGLERYKVENDLLEKALRGRDIRLEFERLRASGAIPPGTPGECWFEETRDAIEGLAQKVRGLRGGDALAPVTVDLAISDFRICGPVSGLYPGGLIRHRCRESNRHLVALWVTHLVLECMSGVSGSPRPLLSAMCTGKSDCIFDCPEDSPKLLGELLEIYWQGLRRPAPFFPNSSLAYAEALMKGKDNPGEDARKCWEGNDYNYGEMQDPYMRRCFPTFDPRGSYEFARIAETVVMPALKRKRGRKKAS